MFGLTLDDIKSGFEIASGVVTVASLVVAGTPTPAMGTPLGMAYKVIECLALTIGKAKEKN